MTAQAGAPSARKIQWLSIIWETVEETVKRLQLRIAKAIKLGRYSKAKSLQWLLTHSYHAKQQKRLLDPKQVLHKYRNKNLVLFLRSQN